MYSGLKHAWFVFNFATLHHYTCEEGRRAMKISTKPELKLSEKNRRHRTSLKRSMARSSIPVKLVKNHDEGLPAGDKPIGEKDLEQRDLQNEAQNFGNARGGNGDGGNNGNGSGSGGGGHNEDDELESNQDSNIGIEWWWWWKWQQTRLRSQAATSGSHWWPVDAALQVVANEVKESIEPAVRAIVVEPLKEHTKHGLMLFLVVGAFAVACAEMVAGLAVVSMGVSLGVVAALGSAFLWWSWTRPATSPSPPDNGNGNSNGETSS